MKLYHDPSSRSVRVQITLEELGTPYELAPVNLARGECRGAAHRQRHPLGQLPVLECSGQYMIESVGICIFLADRYREAALCPPVEHPERSPYLQWCTFVSGSLEPAILGDFLAKRGTQLPGAPGLDDVLTALAEQVDRHDHLLKFGFSTADILVGTTIAHLAQMGMQLPEALRVYLQRLAARPSFGCLPGEAEH